MRQSANFSMENAGQKRLAQNIQSDEKQGLTIKTIYLAKLAFNIKGQIKEFPDAPPLKKTKQKTKGIHPHQHSITRNV